MCGKRKKSKRRYAVMCVSVMWCILLGVAGSVYSAVQNDSHGHVSMQYMTLKEFASAGAVIDADDAETQAQLSAEIERIVHDLRSRLFRNTELIGTLSVLRYDIFTELLSQKIDMYETLKHSTLSQDVKVCDELFEQMSRLEVKISAIERTIQRVEEKLFIQAAQEHFETICKKLRKVRDDNFLKRSQIKKEVLLLLKAIANRFNYSDEIVTKLDAKLADIEKLIKTYSYWESVEYDSGEIMDFGTWEPPVKVKLPTYQTSEMQGRRNYLKTLVDRENDMRDYSGLDNPTHLKDTAPIYTGDTFVRREIIDRRKDKYRK